jgi:hypothetical protein
VVNKASVGLDEPVCINLMWGGEPPCQVMTVSGRCDVASVLHSFADEGESLAH